MRKHIEAEVGLVVWDGMEDVSAGASAWLTYHAFGTWMPDREEGYVKRGKGVLPTDLRMAEHYREAQKERTVSFDDRAQRALIQIVVDSQDPQSFRGHYIATEATHLHVLLGWRDDRKADKMRAAVKASLSRRLNKDLTRRKWLSDGGSMRRVRDQEHFDYLVKEYLPSHRGWKWCEGRGMFH